MSKANVTIIALACIAVATSVGLAAWLTQPPTMPSEPANSGRADSAGAPSNDKIRARVSALQVKLENDPQDLDGWKMLGRAYMALGQFRAAVEAWSWAKELDPNDPQAAAALEELAEIARRRGVHKKLAP